MDRFRVLLFFSTLSSRGRLSLLLEPFAVALLIAFMPVESQQFALRAAWEKLRVCYRARRMAFNSSAQSRSAVDAASDNMQKENGAYGIRTRDLLNAIEALYQLS